MPRVPMKLYSDLEYPGLQAAISAQIIIVLGELFPSPIPVRESIDDLCGRNLFDFHANSA